MSRPDEAAGGPAAPGAGQAGGELDPVAAAALALVGPEAAAWVVALGAGVPHTADPWLAPVAGLAVPPELELRPRDPR